jgi:hypothetical protein
MLHVHSTFSIISLLVIVIAATFSYSGTCFTARCSKLAKWFIQPCDNPQVS